jgi:hypothetical protein
VKIPSSACAIRKSTITRLPNQTGEVVRTSGKVSETGVATTVT